MWHQFCCFIGGVAVHDTLVPCPSGIDTLCDVWRLGYHIDDDFQVVIITDVMINIAGDFGIIHVCCGGNFTADDEKTMTAECLYGNPTEWILPQTLVQYRI